MDCTTPPPLGRLAYAGRAAGDSSKSWEGDPFKATLLWERIVQHMEAHIKCGRHTHKLKIYDRCFRGTQAVACLSTYLNATLSRTISREQVLTLCQKLVRTGVMEDVRDCDAVTFKEGHLYRLSKEHFWETPSPTKANAILSSKRLAEVNKVYMYLLMHYFCHKSKFIILLCCVELCCRMMIIILVDFLWHCRMFRPNARAWVIYTCLEN